jgi:threonine dehydratase
VSDDELKQAMRHLLFSARILAEPSGAVTTAAAMFHRHELPRARNMVAVVSGGNIEPELFFQIMNGNRPQ